MSFQPINSSAFNPLNLEINKMESSKEINVLRVLYGDKSNAEGLKSTLILTKNLASSASKHSVNQKLTQD
jgi:hypothetical protein